MPASPRRRPDLRSAPATGAPASRIHGDAHWRAPTPDEATVRDCAKTWAFQCLIICIGCFPSESLLLHYALQRMLMFSGKVHDLRHFGLGNLIGEDAAFPDPVLMHMHHDPMGRLLILVEEALENMDHELHRRVIVIEQQDPIEVRPLGLRLGLGNNRSARSALAFPFAIVIGEACRRHSVGNFGSDSNGNRWHWFVRLPDLRPNSNLD